MKIRGGSFGQDCITHVYHQLQNVLVDRVRIRSRRLEFLSGVALQLRVSDMAWEFNLE